MITQEFNLCLLNILIINPDVFQWLLLIPRARGWDDWVHAGAKGGQVSLGFNSIRTACTERSAWSGLFWVYINNFKKISDSTIP